MQGVNNVVQHYNDEPYSAFQQQLQQVQHLNSQIIHNYHNRFVNLIENENEDEQVTNFMEDDHTSDDDDEIDDDDDESPHYPQVSNSPQASTSHEEDDFLTDPNMPEMEPDSSYGDWDHIHEESDDDDDLQEYQNIPDLHQSSSDESSHERAEQEYIRDDLPCRR